MGGKKKQAERHAIGSLVRVVRKIIYLVEKKRTQLGDKQWLPRPFRDQIKRMGRK